MCHEHDVPVLSRGGATSLAGQCCNTAVVLDWSKHCTDIESLDAEAGTLVVQPGIALDPLNDHLARWGWMVGPKPSTHVSCTIGGMIGNNSCGSTAQAYGKMADSVRRLEILTYDGHRMWVGPTTPAELERITATGDRTADIYTGLRQLADTYADEIRARYPDIPPPGIRLQPRPTVAREQLPCRPPARRLGKHPGHRPAGGTVPGAGAGSDIAGPARVRQHLRRRRRRPPRSSNTPRPHWKGSTTGWCSSSTASTSPPPPCGSSPTETRG